MPFVSVLSIVQFTIKMKTERTIEIEMGMSVVAHIKFWIQIVKEAEK